MVKNAPALLLRLNLLRHPPHGGTRREASRPAAPSAAPHAAFNDISYIWPTVSGGATHMGHLTQNTRGVKAAFDLLIVNCIHSEALDSYYFIPRGAVNVHISNDTEMQQPILFFFILRTHASATCHFCAMFANK